MIERREHHQCSERMVVLLSLNYFQKVIIGKSILIATTNTTVVLYIQIGLTPIFSVPTLQGNTFVLGQSSDPIVTQTCHKESRYDSGCHVSSSSTLYQSNTTRMGITVIFVSS